MLYVKICIYLYIYIYIYNSLLSEYISNIIMYLVMLDSKFYHVKVCSYICIYIYIWFLNYIDIYEYINTTIMLHLIIYEMYLNLIK